MARTDRSLPPVSLRSALRSSTRTSSPSRTTSASLSSHTVITRLKTTATSPRPSLSPHPFRPSRSISLHCTRLVVGMAPRRSPLRWLWLSRASSGDRRRQRWSSSLPMLRCMGSESTGTVSGMGHPTVRSLPHSSTWPELTNSSLLFFFLSQAKTRSSLLGRWRLRGSPCCEFISASSTARSDLTASNVLLFSIVACEPALSGYLYGTDIFKALCKLKRLITLITSCPPSLTTTYLPCNLLRPHHVRPHASTNECLSARACHREFPSDFSRSWSWYCLTLLIDVSPARRWDPLSSISTWRD
jgi:hypothetical protein